MYDQIVELITRLNLEEKFVTIFDARHIPPWGNIPLAASAVSSRIANSLHSSRGA